MIPKEDGKLFLQLARDSIKTSFSDNELEEIPTLKKKYSEKQGCFVTIHKHGQLRGCIGFPEPYLPLYNAIIDAARSAAFRDPRFPRLSQDELDEIDLEISILTVPKLIEIKSPEDYLKFIKIGKHGLIIRNAFSSGLLLPQVATEWNFSPEEFLECLCQKAGLPKGSWKSTENKIYYFEAQIFSEKD